MVVIAAPMSKKTVRTSARGVKKSERVQISASCVVDVFETNFEGGPMVEDIF